MRLHLRSPVTPSARTSWLKQKNGSLLGSFDGEVLTEDCAHPPVYTQKNRSWKSGWGATTDTLIIFLITIRIWGILLFSCLKHFFSYSQNLSSMPALSGDLSLLFSHSGLSWPANHELKNWENLDGFQWFQWFQWCIWVLGKNLDICKKLMTYISMTKKSRTHSKCTNFRLLKPPGYIELGSSAAVCPCLRKAPVFRCVG